MTAMDIELDPPHGITGFPLGLSLEELKSAAATLGRVDVTNEGSASVFNPLQVLAVHPQFEILFDFQEGKTLRAAEIWIPRSGPEAITVRFRGIDVFTTPALQLLQQLGDLGLAVRQIEPNHWVIPSLSLGFTRTAGHEVPLDSNGDPLYFQAVLTGTADYYDFLLGT